MTKENFNKWLRKNYEGLRRAALKMDPETGEDLFHDVVVLALSNRRYLSIRNERGSKKNAIGWFIHALKNKRTDRQRTAFSQASLDSSAVPEEGEVYIMPVEDKLLLETLWPKLSMLAQFFLYSTEVLGRTAKEAYYFSGDTRDYSTVLKEVKADIERVRKIA